jgi:pre-60S factor REI1
MDDEIQEFYDYAGDSDDEWEEVSNAETAFVSDDGAQLHLASGNIVGHRSYKRFWRQRIKETQVMPGSLSDPEMVGRLLGNYTQLGYLASTSFSKQLALKQRVIIKNKFVQTKHSQKQNQDYRVKVGIRTNGLQKHYRDPTGFIG